MGKKILVAGLMMTGLFASSAVLANTCLPKNLQENKKFHIEFEGKLHHVKVLKIKESGCWVKVKDVLHNEAATDVPVLKRNPYWVNFQHVASVK